MTTDLDRLIREADPARDFNPAAPDAAAARTPPRRDQQRRLRVTPAGMSGGALSVAVVLAVVLVVVQAGHHAPTGTSRSPRTAVQRRRAAAVVAHVLPSRYYCTRDSGNFITPCSDHQPRGFARVQETSELLVNAQFIAPAAVDSQHRFYEVTFRLTRSAGCDAGSLQSPSDTTINTGQRVTLQAFLPLSCPGVVHVTVRYVPDDRTDLNLASLPTGSRVIGRSAVSVR